MRRLQPRTFGMARADGLEVWIIRCVLAVLAIAYFGVLAFNGVYEVTARRVR